MKKAGNRPDRNIYAAYRGEEYIGEGTLDEIAALAGVSRRTAQWCKCPVAVRRMEAREKKWREDGRRMTSRGPLLLVLVEEAEDEADARQSV